MSWDLPRKVMLRGKVTGALRGMWNTWRALPREKSSCPVLLPPSWEQPARKYISSQKLYEGLGCKHLSVSSFSRHRLHGQCWVLWGSWKTACHILFGVMRLVRVSKVSESLCYDELASGFHTGHLTEGLWAISVNTVHANIVILGSCSKKAAA